MKNDNGRGTAGNDSGGTGDDGNDGGGNDNGGGGTDDGDGNDDGNDGAGDSDRRKRETERALKDLQRFKRQAKEAADKAAKLEDELNALKDKAGGDDLAAKLERAEARAKTAEEKHNNMVSAYVYEAKRRALEPVLSALGFRKDAARILDKEDLEGVEHEVTSNGRVIVHDVASWADQFKKDNPFAFDAKKTKNVHGGGGSGSGGGSGGGSGKPWTAERVVELETKLKREKRFHTTEGKAEFAAAVKAFKETRTKS